MLDLWRESGGTLGHVALTSEEQNHQEKETLSIEKILPELEATMAHSFQRIAIILLLITFIVATII